MFVRCLAAWCLAALTIFGLLPPVHASSPVQRQSTLPTQAPKERPDDVLARARQVLSEEGPKPALPMFQRALSLYRADENRRGEAITLGLVGNCYKKFGEHARAVEYLNAALAIKRELGDRLEEGKTLSHLGLVYWETAQYSVAIEHLTRSIAIGHDLGDRQLEGSALNNLALVYDEIGDYRRSLEQYQHVLEIYRGADFERGESDTLGNIGGVHLLLGQYGEALRYYERAFAISERLNLKPSASQDLGNMALCYAGLGQIGQALAHFDRALQLSREAGLKKEEADWLKGKAGVLARTGQYTAAMEVYDQALRVYMKANLQRELIEALNDHALLHERLGDVPSAERSFRRALQLSRAIGHARGVTANLAALGDLEARRKRFTEARRLYVQALTGAAAVGDHAQTAAIDVALAFLSRDEGHPDDATVQAGDAVREARAWGAQPLEAEALFARSETARASGRFEDALRDNAAAAEIAKHLADPELEWQLGNGRGQALEAIGRSDDAVASYQGAVRTIEAVRSQLREERFRASYVQDKYVVYASLIQLLLKLGRAPEAFLYAEKLRSRQYLERMRQRLPPTDEEGRQNEVILRERIRRLDAALEQEQAKPLRERQQRGQAAQLLAAELMEAEREYENQLEVPWATVPASAAASLKGVTSSDVQRRLAPDDALLEYVVSSEAVSIFVVRSGSLHAKIVPIRSVDLTAKVELLRDLIKRQRGGEWRAPAASLHQALVAPMEQEGWLAGVHRLYISPHGILHYLPFAALSRSRDQRAPLLVQEFVLAYLPAAAALDSDRPLRPTAESVMALAPARTELPYSREEAAAVAGMFANAHLLLVGGQATESAFKASASGYDVLHLATHGFFNKFNPLMSGVQLRPSRGEDGRLELHEILRLRLNAALVVLSACDTALGSGYFAEVPAGDDIVGLTRAFLSAGSRSVIASLWAVNDRSTMRLMRAFYSELTPLGKAKGLAAAQRKAIAQRGRYSHPYFWAAFVLVGQME